ncbi:hypothetical protein RB200_05880 [Streptomyces sp. PmtG]
MVPWETLWQAWDALIAAGYNDKGSAIYEVLKELVETWGRELVNLDYTSDEQKNFETIRGFVEVFKDPGTTHHDDARPPEGLDDFRNFFTWLPRNLFVGPKARSDDPGSGFEVGSKPIIGNAFAQRNKTFHDLNRYRKKPGATNKLEQEGKEGVKGLLDAFTAPPPPPPRPWPYDTNQWEEGAGGKYKIKAPQGQQAAGVGPTVPALGVPRGIDVIDIGGTRLELVIRSDDDGYLLRGVSAANLRMADLLDWVGETWGVVGEIPEGLRSFELQYLTIEVLTVPGGLEQWEVTAATETRFADTVADLLVCFIHSTPQGGASSFSLSADAGFTASVGGEDTRLWFSGAIARTGSGAWELSAAFEDYGRTLSLAHLAAAFGLDIPAELEPLVPSLASASFAYRLPTAAGGSSRGELVLSAVVGRVGVVVASVPAGTGSAVSRLVAVRGQVGARASQLPGLGESIPAERDLVFGGVHFAHAFGPWTKAQVAQLNAVVDGLGTAAEQLPRLPDEALPPGSLAWVDVTVGGTVRPPLVLRLPAGGTSTALARTGANEPAKDLDLAGFAIGPVRFHHAGIGYADKRLSISLDATMTVGPLTVELLGLGLGVDQDWNVAPVLRGASVAVAYPGPPQVAIAGAFTRIDLGTEFDLAFAAAGRIEIQDLIVLQLVGSWARNRAGWHSIFAYAELVAGRNRVNGLFSVGPVTFTGLALGFGINSTVRIPAVHEIGAFPLVNRLGAQPPGDGGEVERLTPGQALNELVGPGGWVTPARGQYWVAGGMEFTVYRFVQARAMALVEWGPAGWKAVLAGRTTLALPPVRTAQGSQAPATVPGAETVLAGGGPLGQVIVDFVFAYDSAIARFSMDTVIADGSYLLDPQARLTGGISFYVWGKDLPAQGVRKGFVLTAGGYHPQYQVPAHYPKPPRIGWVWERGPVSIRAQAYAALTDGAFMAGGELAAVYDNGHGINLRAWFTAYVHALVQWKPFYADLALGLSIGVAATVKVLFVRVRISLEVGVDLQLWLPPIGGKARVKIWFITFTLGFGSDRKGAPPANWEEFQVQLPAPSRTVLKQGCELPDVTQDETEARAAAAEPELVRIDGFTAAVESALPASKITLNGALFAGSDSARIDIRPMRLTGVVSEQVVRILDQRGNQYDWEDARWTVTATREGLPQALWGKPLAHPSQALNKPGLVDGCLTGLTIKVPEPTRRLGVGPVPVKALDVDGLPPGRTPLRDETVAGRSPVTDPHSIELIGDTLAEAETAARRTRAHDALDALGLAPDSDGPLTGTARLTGTSLTDAPLLDRSHEVTAVPARPDLDITFYDHLAPATTAGVYTITVEHRLTKDGQRLDTTPELPKAEGHYEIRAAQFHLDPTSVHATYPAAGAAGRYTHVLPHITLSRAILPWERQLLGRTAAPAPWLALLVLAEGETADDPDAKGEFTTRTIGRLRHPAEAGTVGPELSGDIDDDLSCRTIDVPVDVFHAVVPREDELPHLTHMRDVRITPQLRDDGEVLTEGEYAVVAANRFPRTPGTYAVHLVSLEGHLGRLAPGTLSGSGHVRLCSLWSWSFTNAPDGTLDPGMLLRGLVAPGAEDPENLALRHAPASGSASAPEDQYVRTRLHHGYGAVAHRTLAGEATYAWYRGPLTPLTAPNLPGEAVEGPHTTADHALIYDREYGVFDVSYAAAWTLGRTIALADPDYTGEAVEARRALSDRAATLAALGSDPSRARHDPYAPPAATALDELASSGFGSGLVQALRADLRPEPAPALAARTARAEPAALLADPRARQSLSAVVTARTPTMPEWLDRLALLRGVPYDHLVPDPRLLPPESLRAFRVDPAWIRALVAGATDVGAHTSVDRDLDPLLRERLLQGFGSPIPAAGLLINSELVRAWPVFDLLATRGGEQVGELRRDHLAPDILLVLWDAVPDSVVIREPGQGIHFGINSAQRVSLRYLTGDDIGRPTGTEFPDPAGGRTVFDHLRPGRPGATQPDVLDLHGAGGFVAALSAACGADGDLSPGQLALELVNAPLEQLLLPAPTAEETA